MVLFSPPTIPTPLPYPTGSQPYQTAEATRYPTRTYQNLPYATLPRPYVFLGGAGLNGLLLRLNGSVFR